MAPQQVIIAEEPTYLRGRELGEVPALIAQAATDHGFKQQQLHFTDSPLAGAQHIVKQLQAGDLAFLMVFSQRDEIVKLLQ